jgi:hypothetical protein
MKTLKGIKTTISGNKLTLTADIVDKDYSAFRTQQQTIVHAASDNIRHHRHLQIAECGVMVKTPGKRVGFVLEKQDLIDIATGIEPLLSYAPVATNKLDKTLTVKINSELTPDFQWQVSMDGQVWSNVPGQTTTTLDKSTVKAGQRVRLKATSPAGEMITETVVV